MVTEKIIDVILTKKGAHSAHVIDSTLLDVIFNEEESITSCASGGMNFDNQAFKECIKRDSFICMFLDVTFEFPDEESYMIVMDDEDKIVGQNVSASKMDEFSNRKDIVWLSDDFCLYLSEEIKGDIRFVMLPQKYEPIIEGHMSDCMLFIPATTTDVILKKYYEISHKDNLASVILAYNKI